MKKKIGDLTIKEVRKICKSFERCPIDCPLNVNHDGCGADFTDNTDDNLELVIEVEE